MYYYPSSLQGYQWEEGEVRSRVQTLIDAYKDILKVPPYTYQGPPHGTSNSWSGSLLPSGDVTILSVQETLQRTSCEHGEVSLHCILQRIGLGLFLLGIRFPKDLTKG